MGTVIPKAVFSLWPKAATSWSELGARWCSHTGPTTTSHVFTWGSLSGVRLLWEVKHADIMARRTTRSWRPMWPREGSQAFQDSSDGWRKLLMGLSKYSPFSRGKWKAWATWIFSRDWKLLWKSFSGIPLFSTLQSGKQDYSRQFCPIQSQGY